MTKERTKKLAIITAALKAYLEEEEAEMQVIDLSPVFETNQWRLFGRQELFRNRLQPSRQPRRYR
jgi:hypothetical protein